MEKTFAKDRKITMNIIPLSLCLLIILFAVPADGKDWSGYDYDAGCAIEILGTGAIIPDQDAEIFDYGNGAYHDVQIVSIKRNGRVEIEVYDYDTEDYRTFVMEKDERAKPI